MAKKSTKNVIDEALAKASKKKGGKATAKAAKAPKVEAPESEEEETTAGVSRPRKFDYGIYPASVLRINPDNEVEYDEKECKYNIHKALQDAYALVDDACEGKNPVGIDVNAFQAEDGTRSQIRKMARQGLITITGEDGEVYPKDYVAKPKKAKAEDDNDE